MKYALLPLALGCAFSVYAQPPVPPAPTEAAARAQGYGQRKVLQNNSLVDAISFKSIGPAIMSGRVVDVDVNPADPTIFYVAYASGGLWKTESNGAAFSPLFDHEAVMTIGDVAVNWKNNIIWVGAGENNASRSSYAGAGMYKSTDDGKIWIHLGLDETQHIGRIALHPTNPDVVWVAALGHLYSPNKERGIYKTSDGGKTWKQTLFVNEKAGGVDIMVDADNPNTLYAATWEKERRAWSFVESGEGSGIYKSVDGGETWNLISTGESGFPHGKKAGRIGLDMTRYQGKPVLFAVIDNNFPKDKKKEKDKTDESELTKEKLKTMSKEDFLKMDKKSLTAFLKKNGFPEKYNSDEIVTMAKEGKITPKTLYDYLDEGDSGAGATEIKGPEVYRSDDEGKTWKKTHQQALDNIFFTYGYYFAQIRVTPGDPNQLYIMGLRIIKSEDGGKTWKALDSDNMHSDHHALWIDPNRKGHLLNGNDGGLNMSYDDGKSWSKLNPMPLGQYYFVNADMAEPYNIYGGLQDNGVWMGPADANVGVGWQDNGRYPFKSIMGGDGMQVMVDTRDNSTVYTGFQFGNYFRQNTKSAARPKQITPKHQLGEKPLRFNWQTPIWLSTHNQDVLYFGANKLYRSLNKGDDWEAISEDLTKGAVKGNVPFGTLGAIHESPLKFGLIYAGSDDGLIHVTKDGGVSWTRISDALPSNLWVSRVIASSHDKATVFAALNGYRWDDFNAYVYVSTNYGQTWERIGTDLPVEPVNVIKEDPKNANILYVGTDNGLYVSLNKGKSFMAIGKDLPNVAVHDVMVHPRENDLIVGTHGRSLYVANVEHLQKLDSATLKKSLVLFDVKKTKLAPQGRRDGDLYLEPKERNVAIPFYSKTAGDAKITIKAGKDLVLQQFTKPVKAGLNYIDYNMTYTGEARDAYQNWLNDAQKEDKEAKKIELQKGKNGEKSYLNKGKYKIMVEKDGVKEEKDWLLE